MSRSQRRPFHIHQTDDKQYAEFVDSLKTELSSKPLGLLCTAHLSPAVHSIAPHMYCNTLHTGAMHDLENSLDDIIRHIPHLMDFLWRILGSSGLAYLSYLELVRKAADCSSSPAQ